MREDSNAPREQPRALRPADVEVAQAAYLFGEIAQVAASLDRHFYFESARFEDDRLGGLNAERIQLELDFLRKQVALMGWMADLGAKKLTGSEEVKGDAEAWLVSPMYPGDAPEVRHA